MKKREAIEAAQQGLVRFLGGEGTKIQMPVSMVTPTREREWKPQKAHLEDGTPVIGLKIWGLARS